MKNKHKVTPLGTLLRHIRLDHEVTQTQMAKVIGICSNTLCNIEFGRQGMSIEHAEKIIHYYKLDHRLACRIAVLRSDLDKITQEKILKLLEA